MSAADRVGRMLTLVPWLLERPGVRLEEVAEAFGVEPATLRADLEHLDLCELPGLGGGALFDVTVVADRVVVDMAEELHRPLRLTPREALHLVLRLTAVADAFGDDIPALESALDKIRRAVGIPADATAEIDALPGPWLGALRRAIAEGRRVRLDYQGRRDVAPRRRAVDPWALQVSGGVWYLQAHDDDAGERRTFRLDRIAAVEVLEHDRAHPPPPEPLPAPRYVPGPGDVSVNVRLGPGARWIAEAVDLEEREELGDGWLRVSFPTDAPRHVARLLLAAGPDAEVLQPPELAEEVRDLARRALASYGTAGSQ